MKKVNLLIIATNKYTQFLPALLESAEKFFLNDCKVIYNVFTDQETVVRDLFKDSPISKKLLTHEVEHYHWPYSTLYRYHFFKIHFLQLKQADYYFYIDADTLFKDNITAADILGDRVGTQHCGFTTGRGSYETNPLSTSYVKETEGETYFGGGFWGFSIDEFVKLLDTATDMINADYEKNIIPVWHDESVLNRYLIDNPPTKILTPSYHWPQNNERIWKMWKEQYPCKILLLDKNHEEIRS